MLLPSFHVTCPDSDESGQYCGFWVLLSHHVLKTILVESIHTCAKSRVGYARKIFCMTTEGVAGWIESVLINFSSRN